MIYGMVVAAVFGCYIVSSIILFKFPSILHKRKNVKFVCRHISHRGGAGENYENTMSAFRYAVNLGTDMLELDVHLTRDEQVVVAHDPNLQRTTHSHLSITDLNYAQLPPVKDQLPIDFVPGAFFSKPEVQDRQLPLLETVFQAFPSTPINIDIKVYNELLITKVSELAKRYNREHLTVWGNMSDAITQRCYKENSNMGLLFSMRRVLLLVLQMYTGLLPFLPLKETHLEILMPLHTFSLFEQRLKQQRAEAAADSEAVSNHIVGNPLSSSSNLAAESGSASSSRQLPQVSWWMRPAVSIAHSLVIRPALFSHLAKRGIQTYLWVMNTEEDFHLAFKSGATGVMTDYPSKLKSFLAENPQYLQNYTHVVDQSNPPSHSNSSLLDHAPTKHSVVSSAFEHLGAAEEAVKGSCSDVDQTKMMDRQSLRSAASLSQSSSSDDDGCNRLSDEDCSAAAGAEGDRDYPVAGMRCDPAARDLNRHSIMLQPTNAS